MTAILGIDPGLAGAVACLNENPAFSWVEDMPVIDREYALAGMVALVRDQLARSEIRAVLEVTNARPGQAVQSTWRQAIGIAYWEMALTALAVPYQTVRPQSWTAKLGLPRGADKAQHILLAQRLHPEFAPSLTRKKDHGRADAILIAEWGRRMWLGQMT